MIKRINLILITLCLTIGCEKYDVVIRNGMIYDGYGFKPYVGDVALKGDKVALVKEKISAKGKTEIDATGLAVAPGFINILSWATVSLIRDGRSLSDIKQGVTLEVFGEGSSMGPLNEKMKEQQQDNTDDYTIDWTTLGEYLESLERRGVSTNVASFIGATTLRVHEIGYENRPPTDEELDNMRSLVRQGMEEGALGIGSSLIYAPAFYSSTEELIELCKVAAEYGGMYISHMRSESNKLLEALDELITISEKANIPAEVYHLKAGGLKNHYKMDLVINKINAARASGLDITADMYTYIAGATGLDAHMPPWVQEGGYDKWVERLKDPKIRAKVKKEMTSDAKDWENLGYLAGPDGVLFAGFRNSELREYIGMTLKEVAQKTGKHYADVAMDFVIQDGSRVDVVYFLMSEENVKKQIKLPYMSFGSDAGSIAPEGDFLKYNPHPRAYGNFSRLLGKYVREEKVIPLEEAIYKLTSLTADKLKIKKRGLLKEGYYGDVVLFDPNTISDHATFDDPHQLATGMHHVFVNGVQVLNEGEHTGATPGRVVRGPGYKNN
ncbi:MAG: D-aminoacylase [Candidatus Neomarinimicrobiota bacterium]|nr:D-aminoacylase [Candidatus Neomarinimicrobiota bacterium]MEC9447714.1 D-aminoacylase [Candidatus Neomarinimicrobiota bacterium]|tara:strand:+ start:1185 stop:2846 length:1662 start_codon:yes stop_codon:yes gene_type:complete